MGSKLRARGFFILFLVVLTGTFSFKGYAGTVDPSCSNDFNDVLKARAWMSAKRDVEMAERLILKADSVLEYVCPNLNYSGSNALANSMRDYLGDNFGGNYAGGTHPNIGTCIGMATVWQHLQCRDFNIDDFRRFSELSNADPRSFAPACNEPNRAAKWNASIAAGIPAANGLGGVNAIVPNLQYMTWTVSPSCNNAGPIPTGVMADRDDTGPDPAYHDKICPLPGCYFDPGSLTSESDDACRPQ